MKARSLIKSIVAVPFMAHSRNGEKQHFSIKNFPQFLCLILCILLFSTSIGCINEWTSNGSYGGRIFSLAIDPSTPTTIYAGTWYGVFKSTDAGDSWTNTGSPYAAPVVFLAIDPLTPATIYAGIYGLYDGRSLRVIGGGVFKSTNGGGSWTNTGLTDAQVRSLAIDPVTPTTIYAGTGVSGVFKSTDGGGSWTNIGLTDLHIQSLAIDSLTPTTIYAGTYDGVFNGARAYADWAGAPSH